MYIIIVGGGNIGYYLAKTLVAARHEVLLMEKDRTRYRTISEELGEVVMQGDGCEVAQQNQAGFGRADAVVAATGSDDDNLVVCQMAKMEHNVPRTISRVNDPRNEALFHKLGIDATVSSTKIIYNLIEQEVGGGEVIPLAALNRGNIEIVEDRDRAALARRRPGNTRPAAARRSTDYQRNPGRSRHSAVRRHAIRDRRQRHRAGRRGQGTRSCAIFLRNNLRCDIVIRLAYSICLTDFKANFTQKTYAEM